MDQREQLIRLVQEVINDEDLDRVSVKELRSILIHMQSSMQSTSQDLSDEDNELLLAKYVI